MLHRYRVSKRFHLFDLGQLSFLPLFIQQIQQQQYDYEHFLVIFLVFHGRMKPPHGFLFLLFFISSSSPFIIQDEQQNSILTEITTSLPVTSVASDKVEIADIKDTEIRTISEYHDEDDKPETLEAKMENKRIERTEEPETIVVKVEEPLDICYKVDVDEYCFDKVKSGNCECEEYEKGVVCCNVTDITKSITCLGSTINLKNIHIINYMESEINLTSLNALKQLDSLSMTNGNITKVTGSFSKFTSIKCLNFSQNKIVEVYDRALLHANQLKMLDLSKNNITKLPSMQNITVDVEGNAKISCTNISTALDKEVKFLHKENSYCELETIYTWFNDTASVTIVALEKMKKLNEECPQNCKCEPSYMYYSSNTLEVTAKVDCSSLGLVHFPSKLPAETVELNISNNSISSLSALTNYDNLQRLFVDNNHVSSMEELKGLRFFENFTILSLKNNKIKEIPNYILSSLEKTLSSGKIIYLGLNRLNCDCQVYRNMRYWRLVSDGNEILCGNIQSRVMELKESQMCNTGLHDFSIYIDIIIGIEIILLIALFTKVSYDYYMFKKFSFLPYPASFIILYNQK